MFKINFLNYHLGMTQPLDVLKTRAMNAKPGEFNGLFDIVRHTAKIGPMGMFSLIFNHEHLHYRFFSQASLKATFQPWCVSAHTQF
jgi:hypothetical protein